MAAKNWECCIWNQVNVHFLISAPWLFKEKSLIRKHIPYTYRHTEDNVSFIVVGVLVSNESELMITMRWLWFARG
jgi:hypothetical protein